PTERRPAPTAAVDFLAGLVPGDGDRRARLGRSFAALEEHETQLARRLESGLDGIPGVTRLSRAPRRTPLALFTVEGWSPAEVYHELGKRGVNAPAGSFYAVECARWLGLGEAGAVRAGRAPYTNAADVARLLDGVAKLASCPGPRRSTSGGPCRSVAAEYAGSSTTTNTALHDQQLLIM